MNWPVPAYRLKIWWFLLSRHFFFNKRFVPKDDTKILNNSVRSKKNAKKLLENDIAAYNAPFAIVNDWSMRMSIYMKICASIFACTRTYSCIISTSEKEGLEAEEGLTGRMSFFEGSSVGGVSWKFPFLILFLIRHTKKPHNLCWLSASYEGKYEVPGGLEPPSTVLQTGA